MKSKSCYIRVCQYEYELVYDVQIDSHTWFSICLDNYLYSKEELSFINELISSFDIDNIRIVQEIVKSKNNGK